MLFLNSNRILKRNYKNFKTSSLKNKNSTEVCMLFEDFIKYFIKYFK